MGGKSGGPQQQTNQLQTSQQQSRTESFVAPFQVPFLQSLFGQGAALAGQQQGQIGGVAGPLAGALTGNTLNLLGGLNQQAFATPAAGAINQLNALGGGEVATNLGQIGAGAPAGQEALQGFIGAPGPAVPGQQFDPALGALGATPGFDVTGAFNERIGALGEDIQTQLGRTLGTLGSQAGLAGAFGGSRQALAAGLAGEAAQRTFGREAAGLRGQEAALTAQLGAQQAQQTQALQNQRDIAAAGLGAGLGGQTQALTAQAQQANAARQLAAAQAVQQGGLGQTALRGQSLAALLGQQFGGAEAAGQLGISQGIGQQQALQAGIAGAPGAFNLGLAPFSAQFSPLQNLAGLLGSPIINQLGTSSGTSRGTLESTTQRDSGFSSLLGPLGGALGQLGASFIPGGTLGLTAAGGALDLLFGDSDIF